MIYIMAVSFDIRQTMSIRQAKLPVGQANEYYDRGVEWVAAESTSLR